MKKPQTGFTLVEIAIVLLIVGLLLGGVLKGQELIDSAKTKNLAQDLRSIPAMVHAYQDRFRALPGDDPAAVRHLCSSGDTCTVVGNGNGLINGDWDATSGVETVRFWQHLRLANLMTGSTDTAVVTASSAATPRATGRRPTSVPAVSACSAIVHAAT